jgi:hypothetical protein
MQYKEVDAVLTFDPADARKYEWIYTGQCYYSKSEIPLRSITTDLYYIGYVYSNRLGVINECYSHVSNKALCTFKVSYYEKDLNAGISVLRKRIPYEQVLNEIQSCNCILEIVKEGQTGPTLRYFEAVCYNKKLLTNNAMVVNLPFYDERYMHVFKSASDIDVDWVAKREPVDYHYDGSFSPIHLIELIRKLSER